MDDTSVSKFLGNPNPRTPFKNSSIIVIIATNAPLLFRQLRKLAKRVCHETTHVGETLSHYSGEFVVAFSTVNKVPHYFKDLVLDEISYRSI